MTDAHKIAARMTRLQRDALIDVAPIFDHENEPVNLALIFKGLVSFNRRWWLLGPRHLSITPLGLAVRAIIQEPGT